MGGHLFPRFSICAYSCPVCEAKLFENTVGSLVSSNQQQLECHITIRAPLQGDTAVENPPPPEVPEQKARLDVNYIYINNIFEINDNMHAYINIYISDNIGQSVNI